MGTSEIGMKVPIRPSFVSVNKTDLMQPVREELPLVSCVMATTQPRRRFLSQALKYFSRQTYARKELIVVDDPGAPALELVRRTPAVRYLQPSVRLTLGSKLNLGITESPGKIIQKLDDDDYYHPEFLAATVSALRAGDQVDSVVGCSSCLVLIAATGELKWWNRDLFAGGTLCFFRESWSKDKFPDIDLGEDRSFVRDHGRKQIGIQDPELYIYVRHGLGHVWSCFLESQQREEGAVQAGDDVTEHLRKLPDYFKSLKDCMPGEHVQFYEGQKLLRLQA